MANTYSDATGVLILDRVTPVISALFGAFCLDASYLGNGKAYIARLAEINDPQWSDVLDGLMALAAQLDLPAPDDAEGEDGEDRDAELSMPALIDLIAPHFGPQTAAILHKGRDHAVELSESRLAWDFDVLIQPSATDERGVLLRITNLRAKSVR